MDRLDGSGYLGRKLWCRLPKKTDIINRNWQGSPTMANYRKVIKVEWGVKAFCCFGKNIILKCYANIGNPCPFYFKASVYFDLLKVLAKKACLNYSFWPKYVTQRWLFFTKKRIKFSWRSYFKMPFFISLEKKWIKTLSYFCWNKLSQWLFNVEKVISSKICYIFFF